MRRRKRKRHILPWGVLAVCMGLFLFWAERSLLPALQQISHMQCKAAANRIIDAAVAETMEETDLSRLLLTSGESWTANTTLVNQFCSLLGTALTDDLSLLPQERIEIPLGAVSRSTLFANTGPKIPFTLLPMGAARVDYETAFTSVGINQINYKIWLNLSIEMKIVNPLSQETLLLERKIMLADLIFGGTVPDHYFQMSAPREYLLTE